MVKQSKQTKATDAANPTTAEPSERRVEIFIDGVRVKVSPELEDAVHRAYQGLFQLPEEMTTTQAAEFLDVSRPFIVKLTRQGELSYRRVGKHRRIRTADLLQYKEKMFQRARTAADEMTQLSQEMGLYDLEGPPPKAK